tara:strand:- start:1570 stop:2202 length:633 start_codon:yes stop_codon:yes gene_type:complete
MNEKFPNKIPIFPLSGVIYFPKTNLPLNIFEQRYLDLVNDTYKKDKLMGMVQSKKEGVDLYNVGCLGKISALKKTEDGRILINLSGLTRFEIIKEISSNKLYREFEVDYKKFYMDIASSKDQEKDIIQSDSFFKQAKKFFEQNGLLLNWREFEKLDKIQQINTLSMISPITNEEKQKLLESLTLEEKTSTLLKIIEFYMYEKLSENKTLQ